MGDNKSNFQKLLKYGWSLGVAIIAGILLYIFTDFVNPTNANYILSSITQGLATLVDLLLVIIFFLCQSIGRVGIFSVEEEEGV